MNPDHAIFRNELAACLPGIVFTEAQLIDECGRADILQFDGRSFVVVECKVSESDLLSDFRSGKVWKYAATAPVMYAVPFCMRDFALEVIPDAMGIILFDGTKKTIERHHNSVIMVSHERVARQLVGCFQRMFSPDRILIDNIDEYLRGRSKAGCMSAAVARGDIKQRLEAASGSLKVKVASTIDKDPRMLFVLADSFRRALTGVAEVARRHRDLAMNNYEESVWDVALIK